MDGTITVYTSNGQMLLVQKPVADSFGLKAWATLPSFLLSPVMIANCNYMLRELTEQSHAE